MYLEQTNPTKEDVLFQYDIKPEEIKNKTVIDIGANIGSFSLVCSDFGANKIIAYEPNVENYKELIKNTQGNNKILNYNMAVYDESLKYIEMKGEGGHSQIDYDKTNLILNPSTAIPTITLSEIVSAFLITDDNNNVLKVDCEGAEHEILYSASRKDIRRFDYIYIEIHGKEAVENRSVNALLNYLLFFKYNVLWHADLFLQKQDANQVIISTERMEHTVFKLKRID